MDRILEGAGVTVETTARTLPNFLVGRAHIELLLGNGVIDPENIPHGLSQLEKLPLKAKLLSGGDFLVRNISNPAMDNLLRVIIRDKLPTQPAIAAVAMAKTMFEGAAFALAGGYSRAVGAMVQQAIELKQAALEVLGMNPFTPILPLKFFGSPAHALDPAEARRLEATFPAEATEEVQGQVEVLLKAGLGLGVLVKGLGYVGGSLEGRAGGT